MIDNEAFLEEGDRDHTASLLGDGFATELRAKESYDAEKQQLQVRLFLLLSAFIPDKLHALYYSRTYHHQRGQHAQRNCQSATP